MNHLWSKWIRWGIVVLFISIIQTGYSQQVTNIYVAQNGDSTLSPAFVKALCEAARTKAGEGNVGVPTVLESLIISAADTEYMHKEQPGKSLRWHRKYGSQCYCEATDRYSAGSFLRQVVHSNFREFANIVGPNNRLSLDLTIPDPNDHLTIMEYINKTRIDLEASHQDKRFEFQQDERWRNIMFFYFLFSEYQVN